MVRLAALLLATALVQPPASDLLRQGAALDLQGKTAEARQLFQSAIDRAADPQARAQAERTMAISWAFDSDCEQAAKFERPVHEYSPGAEGLLQRRRNRERAGAHLHRGRPLRRGRALVSEGPRGGDSGTESLARPPRFVGSSGPSMRSRASRRAAATAPRRSSTSRRPKRFSIKERIRRRRRSTRTSSATSRFTWATTRRRRTSSSWANQNDPFILSLLAQTWEKLGDKAKADDYYRRSLTVSNAHNPPNV